MRIRSDQLPRTLERGLAPAWLVAGDEPLLTGEAADAIRAAARAAGHAARELFFVERGFDWSAVAAAGRALSLFSERRLIEVRLPSPRPGKDGGAVLAGLVSDPAPDTVLLVVTGRLEGDSYGSAWFRAFESAGIVVQCWPVDAPDLPRWIVARAARHGLRLDDEAARLLAERVEGNLLAAHQEIEKLALLHPGGELGGEDVLQAVADSARFDVLQLGEAALAGDLARGLRILDGLRAEGAEPPLVLWSVCRELRALAAVRSGRGGAGGRGRIAERREALLGQASRRLAGRPLAPLFLRAGLVDRRIKGLALGDPWDGLAALVAEIAGQPLPDAPPG